MCSRRSIRLARSQRSGELAVVRGTSRDRLRLIAGSSTLELLADLLDIGSAGSRVDGGRVTEVGVDAGKELSVGSLDTLDNNVPFC